MKKILLLCGALLALSASSSLAAGINLWWEECGTLSLGSDARRFGCDTNAGVNRLVATFVAPEGVNEYLGCESEIEIQTDGYPGSPLPPWWQFKNEGTCRQNSLTLNGDFTAGPFRCADFFGGSVNTAISAYDIGYGGPGRARIRLTLSVSMERRGPLTAGTEYYAYMLTIDHAKTVGRIFCPGCSEGACINLRSIKLVQPAALNDDRMLTNVAQRAYVKWQNPSGAACIGATPARNSTWGAVKAFYR